MTNIRKTMCATCIYRCKDIKRTTPHECHEDYSAGENSLINENAAICKGSIAKKGTITTKPKFADEWDRLFGGTHLCMVDWVVKPKIEELYEIIIEGRKRRAKL